MPLKACSRTPPRAVVASSASVGRVASDDVTTPGSGDPTARWSTKAAADRRRRGPDQLGDAHDQGRPPAVLVVTPGLHAQGADPAFPVRRAEHREPRREAIAPGRRHAGADPIDVGEAAVQQPGVRHLRSVAVAGADRLGEPAQLPPAARRPFDPVVVVPPHRPSAQRAVVLPGTRRSRRAVDGDVQLLAPARAGRPGDGRAGRSGRAMRRRRRPGRRRRHGRGRRGRAGRGRRRPRRSSTRRARRRRAGRRPAGRAGRPTARTAMRARRVAAGSEPTTPVAVGDDTTQPLGDHPVAHDADGRRRPRAPSSLVGELDGLPAAVLGRRPPPRPRTRRAAAMAPARNKAISARRNSLTGART